MGFSAVQPDPGQILDERQSPNQKIALTRAKKTVAQPSPTEKES